MQTEECLPVFIGWDEREAIAADVCKHSLLRHTTIPTHPIYLKDDVLRFVGLYDRSWAWRDGIKRDDRDGRPFSTDFAFTRFLTLACSLYQGWAVFQDCDMLWRGDIRELWDLRDDRYAVQVVKHDYRPTETVKMDGQVQQVYSRKNWSSFMLFNGSHPANRRLTVKAVNVEPGRELHNFFWLKDEEIGELPIDWNYLVGWHSKQDCPDPRVVHYTSGSPFMAGYENCEYANDWFEERRKLEARQLLNNPAKIYDD